MRKFPQTCQQPAFRPLPNQRAPIFHDEIDVELLHRLDGLWILDGIILCLVCGKGSAVRLHGAVCAVRAARRTHRCAQLHQRLIVLTGIGLFRHGLQHRAGAGSFDRGYFNALAHALHARPYAQNVAVHGGRPLCKGDGRNRPGGVIPKALQLFQLLRRLRKASPFHDLPGRCLHIAHTGIVAQPLPELEQLFLRRIRQRPHIRQRLHKAPVIRNHRLDARLLEHDFRYPYGVRLAALPPGQVAPVGRIPRQQSLRHHIVATACAEMPSPRPSKPRRSVVVALTLTCAPGIAFSRLRRISSI